MLIEKSAPEIQKKNPNRKAAFFVTILFFSATVGLYWTLGNFLSSCGTVPVSTTLSIKNYGGAYCVPWSFYNYVDFQSSVSNGWKLKVEVFNASEQFSTYNFGPSTTSGSATIDNQFLRGIQVPNNASYRIRLTMHSQCHCPGAFKKYEFMRTTNLYAAGQLAGELPGFDSPDPISCN
jgi:hypothetical protein